MDAINFAEEKISLAQTLLSLRDIDKFYRIQAYIQELLKEQEVQDEDFDAKRLSFSEWNEQFDNEHNLTDFIPEYGMTVLDYRLKIYNSEREVGMSKDEFVNKLNGLK